MTDPGSILRYNLLNLNFSDMSDISYIGYILGLCYDMSLNPTAEGSLIEKKCNLNCSDVEFDGLEEWIQV